MNITGLHIRINISLNNINSLDRIQNHDHIQEKKINLLIDRIIINKEIINILRKLFKISSYPISLFRKNNYHPNKYSNHNSKYNNNSNNNNNNNNNKFHLNN